jgi:hypothetical protein
MAALQTEYSGAQNDGEEVKMARALNEAATEQARLHAVTRSLVRWGFCVESEQRTIEAQLHRRGSGHYGAI